MPTLRPYQQQAVDLAFDTMPQSPIVVGPTGSGKTVVGVALAQRIGGRCLWIAHRRELVTQAAKAVREAGGRAGLILAGEQSDPGAPFQIASVQTLARRALPQADLLVVDEAHHAVGASYKPVLAAYPKRFGLTATPFRLDGKGLAAAGFGAIIVSAYTDDLCAAGTLHEPMVYAGPAPDMKGVKKTAGDYNLGQMAARVEGAALQGRIVETWKKRAEGRRTVAFAVSIAHAYNIASAFKSAGVEAEVVTGETPKIQRAGILARLAAGVTTVVVNVGVLTEGWDLPALEVAILARPTASLCLHLQTIGRIMRACEGKNGAIVLDHAGNSHLHGLVTDRLVYSLHDKVKRAAPGEAPCKACPDCTKVVPAGTMNCPECGYAWERDDKTSESDAELLPIGHGDSSEARQRRWTAMLTLGRRISHSHSGGLFDQSAIDKGYAIASAKFKARYGTYPLSINGRLIDAAKATPGEWEQLRAGWRGIASRKGWDAGKSGWFVKRCEADAKARITEPVA